MWIAEVVNKGRWKETFFPVFHTAVNSVSGQKEKKKKKKSYVEE